MQRQQELAACLDKLDGKKSVSVHSLGVGPVLGEASVPPTRFRAGPRIVLPGQLWLQLGWTVAELGMVLSEGQCCLLLGAPVEV